MGRKGQPIIRTAVVGEDADSDEPAFCPTDPYELDELREEFAGTKWWCGRLLGGCGGELVTRRCTDDRVCHFCHRPDPTGLLPPCTRRSHGDSSADHLYLKYGTRTWLRRQGHEPAYRFVDHDEAPLGSLVDIDLAGRRLRIHMDPTLPADWDGVGGELILGPGVPVSRERLIRMRYVNRVRFTTSGSSRVITFGTQTADEGTEWFTADECEISPDGRLTTPAVTRIQRTASTTPPAPRQAEPADVPADDADPQGPLQIGALLRLLSSAVRAGNADYVRGLRSAAQEQRSRCEGVALDRLEAVLADADRFLASQQDSRSMLFDRLRQAERAGSRGAVRSLLPQVRALLEYDDGPPTGEEAALISAARDMLRPAAKVTSATWTAGPSTPRSPQPAPDEPSLSKRQRSGLARACRLMERLNKNQVAGDQERHELAAKLAAAVDQIGDLLSEKERRHAQIWIDRFPAPTAPARPALVARQPQLAPDKLRAAAAAVRGALKKAAREQTTTTWERLEQQLGGALPKMTAEEQVQLLIAVDETTPSDQAPLSSLLAAADTSVRQHYPAIAAASGLEVPVDDADLLDVLEADVQQLHDHWRHS
ncbi:hypothetical protein ACOKM5_43515 [Streptomyces sp. BH097]|uniref:hypothetical protein n=1 Tax=unclassified Streptomyces TaxID=2593676 RepID=UPI003BB6CED0